MDALTLDVFFTDLGRTTAWCFLHQSIIMIKKMNIIMWLFNYHLFNNGHSGPSYTVIRHCGIKFAWCLHLSLHQLWTLWIHLLKRWGQHVWASLSVTARAGETEGTHGSVTESILLSLPKRHQIHPHLPQVIPLSIQPDNIPYLIISSYCVFTSCTYHSKCINISAHICWMTWGACISNVRTQIIQT